MNTLVGLRTNIIYSKKKEADEQITFKRHQELIFLIDKPTYKRTNDGEIVRERGVEEVRFIVSEEGFDVMMKQLESYRTVEPEELA